MPTTYGYLTVAQADTYFETRYGASDWAGLDSTTHKAPLLQTAYNRLYDAFSLPPAPAGTELATVQRAQAEMAWYMYKHLEDEDLRGGLQAQGVAAAGVVSETYREPVKIPIPAYVAEILDGYEKHPIAGMVEIGRDENEDLTEDVT